MKKLSNLKTKFIIALLVVAMACFMGVMLTAPENNHLVKADKVVISGQIFSDEYNINSEVDFPSEIQVEYNGKSLVTVGLDIETLVKTWRETFGLQEHDIYLETMKEQIEKLSTCGAGAKSVKELFEEQRVYLREVEE